MAGLQGAGHRSGLTGAQGGIKCHQGSQGPCKVEEDPACVRLLQGTGAQSRVATARDSGHDSMRTHCHPCSQRHPALPTVQGGGKQGKQHPVCSRRSPWPS